MRLGSRFLDPAWREQAIPRIAVCLALLLAAFAQRTPGALPAVRLRETRIDFLLCLLCNNAFLYVAWTRLRAGRKVFAHAAMLAGLAYFGYLCLSAARAPIRSAAFEEWVGWTNAMLAFVVAAGALADYPRKSVAALAAVFALVGLIDWLASLNPAGQPAPEQGLAIGLAFLCGASVAAAGLRDAVFEQSSLPRLAALALAALLAAGADWFFQGVPEFGPSEFAASEIASLHPVDGAGLGALPDALVSFANGDYPRLPYPQDGYLGLRAEQGWLGAGLLGLFAAACLLRALRLNRLFDLDSRAILRFGLAGAVAFAAMDCHWRPIAFEPFGRIAVFALMGLILGIRPLDEPEPRRRAMPLFAAPWRRFAQPWIFALGAWTAAIVWLSVEESRPWRAAAKARLPNSIPLESEKARQRLESATRIYPADSSHWALLGAHWREALSAAPFHEETYRRVVEAYERAIAANPYQFRHYSSLAVVQHKAERAEDMVNTLRRGLDCLPFSEPLRRWVVKAHLDAGDLRAAIEEMQNLALTIAPTIPDKRPGAPPQINPDWIQIHFRLAEYYEALDEPERALDQYSIALKKDPTGPFAKEIQAQIERLKAKIVAENAP